MSVSRCSHYIISLLLQKSLRYLVHTRILKVQNKQRRPRRQITHPVHREINLAHGNRKHADKVPHAVTVLTESFHPADERICLADTCEPAHTMTLSDSPPQHHPSTRLISPMARRNKISCIANRMTNNNHSIHLEQVHELTDLDSCRINKEKCQYESERCTTASERCVTHNNDVYGKESIRKRVENDEYSGTRADLKFKCSREARWMGPIGRTMGVRVSALAVVGLLLATLATCAAAPTNNRPTRSAHHEKSAVSYLNNLL